MVSFLVWDYNNRRDWHVCSCCESRKIAATAM